MSILSTHLWGTRRTVTPLSPVGERVARMRASRVIPIVRFLPLAILAGFVAQGGAFMLVGPLVMPRVVGTAKPWIVQLADALGEIRWSALVGFCIAVVWFGWVMPALIRLGFDRSANARSVERRAEMRRGRRRAPLMAMMMLLPYPILFAVTLAFGQWRIALTIVLLAMLIGGPALMVLGCQRRANARVVCGRCQFPMGSWRGSGTACPECGQHWKEPWRAELGARRPHRDLLTLGATLYLLALAVPPVSAYLFVRGYL